RRQIGRNDSHPKFPEPTHQRHAAGPSRAVRVVGHYEGSADRGQFLDEGGGRERSLACTEADRGNTSGVAGPNGRLTVDDVDRAAWLPEGPRLPDAVPVRASPLAPPRVLRSVPVEELHPGLPDVRRVVEGRAPEVPYGQHTERVERPRGDL